MKKLCLSLILLCSIFIVFAQDPEIAIIPQPVSLQKGSGQFVINEKTHIVAGTGAALPAANALREKIKRATGFSLISFLVFIHRPTILSATKAIV
jgi:hexosaminidase